MDKRSNAWFELLVPILFILSGQVPAWGQGPSVPDRPNILWLVAEDMSPYLATFGDPTVSTPNLDRLAAEGVRYTNAFSVSGVCSPSRAALATGMYPTSIGAHHMRTTYQQPAAREMGLINYEVVPPPHVRMVSEIMREHGYYASNNSKEDYQFHPSLMAWNETSLFAHWRNRPADQPFYAVFNFGATHESQVWNPGTVWNLRYGREVFPPDRDVEVVWRQHPPGERKELYIPADLEVPVPPYLPETPTVIEDVRQMYSNLVEMDGHVGVVLGQLEEDGLLDDTIIVWYTDHGGPLPRQKRLLYDSGLHVPLIIRYPDQRRAGEVDDRLVSFVDFAPTLLSQAGIAAPDYMQGRAFDGEFAAEGERSYIFAAGDRFDAHYDTIRAVRDKRYKYLRNFQPERGYYLPLDYRERMASMQELLRLRDAGELNEIQSQWFRSSKPEEELFDTWTDPHELNNLADDPAHAERLAEFRQALQEWMDDSGDMGFIPETDLIEQFWPGQQQPGTADPIVESVGAQVTISSATEGASIGYRRQGESAPWSGWRLVSGPLRLEPGEQIEIVAHRLGYAPSETVTYTHR